MNKLNRADVEFLLENLILPKPIYKQLERMHAWGRGGEIEGPIASFLRRLCDNELRRIGYIRVDGDLTLNAMGEKLDTLVDKLFSTDPRSLDFDDFDESGDTDYFEDFEDVDKALDRFEQLVHRVVQHPTELEDFLRIIEESRQRQTIPMRGLHVNLCQYFSKYTNYEVLTKVESEFIRGMIEHWT